MLSGKHHLVVVVDIGGVAAMAVEVAAMAVEVAAMAVEVAAMAMSVAAANDAMAAATAEEVLGAIDRAGTKPDMVGTEDVVAMAPATDIVVAATTTTTTSRHTVFKAR